MNENTTTTAPDDKPRTCSHCGGKVPEEGSVAWNRSRGDCPGRRRRDVCGAFSPGLPRTK